MNIIVLVEEQYKNYLTFFKREYSGVGCGRSVHGLAAIAKAANVLVDFTHDM